MITTKESYWKYSLIVLIFILGWILLRELSVFSGGFLGAFTIYILVRGQMHRLTEKRNFHKNIAAVIILVEVIVCFLIPANILVALAVKVINYLSANTQTIEASLNSLITFLQEKAEVDLLDKDILLQATSIVTKVGKVIVNEVSSFLVNALVLLFVLFFMLVSSREMEKYLYELLPFNTKNKEVMSSKIKKMVVSNAIGIPLLAMIQGVTATIGYFIFDVPLASIFGIATCFATIIPLVGTALIWFPLVLYLLFTGDWMNALGLAIYGLIIISNVDNLFRFLLQKKMANIHPLITVFGVIIGLTLFGFWGVIFGPVLISIFLILVDMFKNEYLDKKTEESCDSNKEEECLE